MTIMVTNLVSKCFFVGIKRSEVIRTYVVMNLCASWYPVLIGSSAFATSAAAATLPACVCAGEPEVPLLFFGCFFDFWGVVTAAEEEAHEEEEEDKEEPSDDDFLATLGNDNDNGGGGGAARAADADSNSDADAEADLDRD